MLWGKPAQLGMYTSSQMVLPTAHLEMVQLISFAGSQTVQDSLNFLPTQWYYLVCI